MAAINGDQKQKLYILAGFLGVLVLVGFFVMSNHAPDAPSAAAPAPAPAPKIIAGAPAKPQVAVKPTAAPVIKVVKVPAKPPKVVVAKAPVILVAKIEPSRPDPFEPFYYPTPEPVATPTPVPPPVELPLPPASVPLPALRLASSLPNTVLIGLPRPRVANYVLPGPIYLNFSGGTSSTKGGGDAIPIRSSNKRLSGVIIGDSVRALLEITTGDTAGGAGGEGGGGAAGAAAATTIVRVVQPGDEVDGIKILRIERVYEGGRQITRMFVREGNEERFVDLRPSPTPPAAAGAGGAGGFGSPGGSSSPGGSGSPFGAIRPAPGGFPRGGRP